jgi:REP element-mobilizing transposase RayT
MKHSELDPVPVPDPPPPGHLRRLDRIYARQPVYFVTTCVQNRQHRLANGEAHQICREVWETGETLHNWSVGRYVNLPDHVHFFCQPAIDSDLNLSRFVGSWKEWTAKFLARRCQYPMPLWQEEFFDHVVRADESLDEKWEYVRNNPVRHGYVQRPRDWEFQGTISTWRRYRQIA